MRKIKLPILGQPAPPPKHLAPEVVKLPIPGVVMRLVPVQCDSIGDNSVTPTLSSTPPK